MDSISPSADVVGTIVPPAADLVDAAPVAAPASLADRLRRLRRRLEAARRAFTLEETEIERVGKLLDLCRTPNRHDDGSTLPADTRLALLLKAQAGHIEVRDSLLERAGESNGALGGAIVEALTLLRGAPNASDLRIRSAIKRLHAAISPLEFKG